MENSTFFINTVYMTVYYNVFTPAKKFHNWCQRLAFKLI